MVGMANQMFKIECCWHALNQNRGGTVVGWYVMPGRRCLCRFNKFIVHMKQEKSVSGSAMSGCLAFCAGVIDVPCGWRCRSCRLSSEEVIRVIAP